MKTTDMNLPKKDDFPLFYAYANAVCKGIKSKKTRDEVKVELFSHLFDTYDRNIAIGMSHEDAEKNAVENMGDTEAVSATFKKLYPFSPESFAKSITSELICGIFYSFFAIFIFASGLSWTWIFFLSSIIRIITSISHLKKVNRFFAVVFYTAIINLFATGTIWAYQLYFTAGMSVIYAILIINCTLASICYVFLFLGFSDLKSQQETLKKSKRFEIFLYAASLIFVQIGMTVLKMLDFQEALKMLLSLFVYPIFILCAVYSLLAIHRFTYLLEDLDILPQKQSKVNRLFLASLMLIFLLSFFAVGYASARRQPKAVTPIYTSNEELADIKENMLALGFPKERLAELTNEEISKYRGAYQMYIDANDEDIYYSALDNISYTTYAFYLPEDDDRPQRIRYIMYLEYQDNQKFLRSGLYFSPSYRSADPEDAYELNEYDGAYYRILCDVDDETKEIIPFYQNSSSLGDSKTPVGCDFNFLNDSKNRRAYFAQTVIPSEYTVKPTYGMVISSENDIILINCKYYSQQYYGLHTLWNTPVEDYFFEYENVYPRSYNHGYIYAKIGDDSEDYLS